VDNDYGFTQKERDDESGLHYFEARYLAGPIARFISPDPKYARLDGLSVDDLSSFLSRPSGINPYQYGGNNPLRYNDPTGLDKVDTAGKTADVVGIVAGVIEEADNVAGVMGKALPKALTTGGSIAGPVSSAVSVGIKAWEFGKDPSYATGGQLANEGAKALVGVAVPPVGLIWSVLDLTGYGPSAILEHTEKSIQANRAATRAYERATAASRQTVDLVNEKAPKIKAKLQQVDTKLQHLVRETDKLNQKTRKALKGETRSLQELNDAIRRQERINRRTAAELRRANARLREAEK
jgi:RHS repeat-associated protein